MKTQSRQQFDVYQLPLTGRHLIEASAGTGKTWSITGLYVRLLVERDLSPEHIVVVTFTKAATEELTGRIRERVQLAYDFFNTGRVDKEQGFFADLTKEWQKSDLNLDQQTILIRLKNALASFDRAAIYTIHSFCQRLLTEFTFEANGQWGLTAIQDQQAYEQQIAEDVWRQTVTDCSDSYWLRWLMDDEEKPPHSPTMWLAEVRPHLGKPYLQPLEAKPTASADDQYLKAKACYQQLTHLWQTERDPLLAVMAASYSQLNGQSYKKPKPTDDSNKLNQFQADVAALDQLLRPRAEGLPLPSYPHDTLKERWQAHHLSNKTKKGCEVPKHPLFTALQKYAEAMTEVRKAYEWRYRQCLHLLWRRLNQQLPEVKQQQGELAFDDMLLGVYQALESTQSPLIPAVRQRFKAALIDEFQDTDPLQLAIFERLFTAHVPTNASDSKKDDSTLLFVGDPKQAIYAFRGADIHAYLQAAKDTPSQQTLTTNYRSTPAMVDSINALFAHQTPAFMDHDIAVDWVKAKEKPTLVGLESAALSFALAMPGGKERFSKAEAEPEAIADTANRIAHLLTRAQKGEVYFLETTQADAPQQKTPFKPSDIAVLVPDHKSAAAIYKALNERGVKAVRRQQDSVLQSLAAQCLLQCLCAINEPTQERPLMRLLAHELLGLSSEQLVSIKHSPSVWQAWMARLESYQESYFKEGFHSVLRAFLQDRLLLVENDDQSYSLMQQLLQRYDGERHLTDLMHLGELCQEQSRRLGSLAGLIHWLEQAVNAEGVPEEHLLRLESDSGRVQIVTQHSSKGLEYPIVFCPYLWDGKKRKGTPSVVAAYQKTGDSKTSGSVVDFGSDQQGDLLAQSDFAIYQEKLRLLYVTLTRSVYHCHIFWAPVGYGKLANSPLSWLLYGDSDCLTQNHPLQGFQDALSSKKLSAGAFEDKLQRFVQQATEDNTHQADIEVVDPALKTKMFDDQTAACMQLKVAPPPKRQRPIWWQSSFTALTRDQSVTLDVMHEPSERQDDSPPASDSSTPQATAADTQKNTIHQFPRGAQPGDCLHNIFEHWDFSSTNESALSDLVAQTLDRFGIDREDQRAKWIQPVCKMVNHTLSTPLWCDANGKHQQALNTLKSDQRIAEMVFLMRSDFSLQRWVSLLCDPSAQLPLPFRYACEQLEPKTVKGFLVGFIDAVFCDDQGRFHVLDWKSNYLGPLTQDYHSDAMEQAMAHHHYYLQAILYLVALHRYLQRVLPNYAPDQHLGGAHYLFLRGMNAAQNNNKLPTTGAYFWQPSHNLIQRLDKALG